jgi:2,5-diketo-D-gluconate reductase A
MSVLIGVRLDSLYIDHHRSSAGSEDRAGFAESKACTDSPTRDIITSTPVDLRMAKGRITMNDALTALTDRIDMPTVGFGTYLVPDDEVASVVGAALRTGYRHVDTAEAYRNESGVGAGLRTLLDAGALSRDDVFVTTKLWPGNAAWGQPEKSFADTLASLDESLDRLALDYVDLYLIHAPTSPELRLEQWSALVELRKRGKTRAIGVANYSETHIEEIQAAGLPLPDADQLELHPWSQKPSLIAYLHERRILPIAYSSLAPLPTWRTAPGHDSAKTEAMRAEGALAESPFRAMAVKHGVTEAQVLLRWGVQKGFAVIPKSTSPDRMRKNFDLFSFTLDSEDMTRIAAMDRGGGVAWSMGDPTGMP